MHIVCLQEARGYNKNIDGLKKAGYKNIDGDQKLKRLPGRDVGVLAAVCETAQQQEERPQCQTWKGKKFNPTVEWIGMQWAKADGQEAMCIGQWKMGKCELVSIEWIGFK